MESYLRQKFMWAHPKAHEEAEAILDACENIVCRNPKPDGSEFMFTHDQDDDFRGNLRKISHLLLNGSYIFFWSDDDYDIHIIVVLDGEVLDLDYGWRVEEFMDPFVERAMRHDPYIKKEDMPMVMITTKSDFVRAICKKRLQGGSQ